MNREFDIEKNLRKANRPELPADYFNQLQKDVMKQIAPVSMVIPIYRRPIFWIGNAAAAVAILVAIAVGTPGEPKNQWAINDLQSDEIANYIHEHIDDFDEDLLVEALREGNDEASPADTSKKVKQPMVTPPSSQATITFQDLTSEEILKYLEEESLDLEEIEEEIEN